MRVKKINKFEGVGEESEFLEVVIEKWRVTRVKST